MRAVHNDFHQTHGIFPLFDGLEIENIEKPQHVVRDNSPGPVMNGVAHGQEETKGEVPLKN